MNTNENLVLTAMQSVEIYTDGGCEPNPGSGGYGVVVLHPRKRVEASGGFRLTTNNRMENFAAIASLEMLKRPGGFMAFRQGADQALPVVFVEEWVKPNLVAHLPCL